MKNIVVAITACVLSTFLLFGCTSNQIKPNPSVQDNTGATLAESAASVSNSLVDLAETERAGQPLKSRPMPKTAGAGMDAIASVDWSGPIEPLVKQLSNTMKYRMVVIGQQPAIPVLVTVYEKDEKIGNILSNVSYQGGNRATIVTFPDRRLLQLRYASN